MRFHQRLQRLEQRLVGDCPRCRNKPAPRLYWSPAEYASDPPQPCPVCGTWPTVVVFEVVPDDWRPERDTLRGVVGWPPAHDGEIGDEREGRDA